MTTQNVNIVINKLNGDIKKDMKLTVLKIQTV